MTPLMNLKKKNFPGFKFGHCLLIWCLKPLHTPVIFRMLPGSLVPARIWDVHWIFFTVSKQ